MGENNIECTCKVTKNLVLQDAVTHALYRILYVSDDEKGYWIRVDSSSNIPKLFILSQIKEQILAKLLIVVPDTVLLPDDESLSAKETLHRDRAWNLIHNIVTIEPDIYIPSKRADLLKIVEIASGIKSCNLYAYLGRYWRSGFQPNALAPNYSQCGGERIATSIGNRVGRHKRTRENGKILNEQDYRNFQQAVDKHLHRGESLSATYREMLAELYVRPRFEGDPQPLTMDADEKPSFSQFYYWYRKHGDVVDDTKAQEGENQFNQRHRAITGRTETYLIGPGDSYQIDATIGDFYLVMESDRSRLVGRPVIVFLKDAWSRMITGMAITLENSSFRVWKAALRNAVTSKIDYCKMFGIEITEEEWPCNILPISLTTDNGEFAVKAVDEIVQTLGVTVENCPPYRGDLKGVIERTFRTYQLELKPFVPGYVDKDVGQRGAEDYRKNSCLDIRTFTAIMIKIVLFYNNHHYMPKYQRTIDTRENGIPAIPRYLWNYGVTYRSGAHRVLELDECLEAFFEIDEAEVTAKGINFNELYYTCELAEKEKWFELARIKGNWKIPIRYDPFLCMRIYLKVDGEKYVPCSLVESSAEYACFTMEELAAAHESDLEIKAENAQDEDQAYSDMSHFIKDKVDLCKGEKESGKVIIETLSRHSMNANKEEEKKVLSGETEARKMQASLGNDNGETSGCAPGEEKPRSYKVVSSEIDQMMDEVLREAKTKTKTTS